MTTATVSAQVVDEPAVFSVIAADGGRLRASDWRVWVGDGGAQPAASQVGFTLEPTQVDDQALHDGELVRVRAENGRYLARYGLFNYLTSWQARASVWQLVRTAGAGSLEVGDSFQLRSRDGRVYLTTEHSWLSVAHHPEPEATWSLGCYFERGPFSARWPDGPSFEEVTGARASNVSQAVTWLQQHSLQVELPGGASPLVVWDDPTLAPDPTVAYLMTDTLWAAKALKPYQPELAAQMEDGLLAAGWYGNGLADTLFHGYPEPAHRPDSPDFVHGTLLDVCAARTPGAVDAQHIQIRAPEQGEDPGWTAGNSAQFSDSAIYTALNEYWNGDVEAARSRLRNVIVDTRSVSDDAMFWDIERGLLVDQASRCEYDSFVGQCSALCSTCTPCTDGNCLYANAAYKLGLVLYAARVTGLARAPDLALFFTQIDQRLWEGQAADGGVPHAMFRTAPGYYLQSTGATGEATAIAVLANTVVSDH